MDKMSNYKDDLRFYLSLLKDSLHYALSDWVAILILGIILCILSSLQEAIVYHEVHGLLILLTLVLLAILSFLEAGYTFKILEESVEGSTKPPLFENYKELFIHGIKDTIVAIVYLVFITFIAGLSVYAYLAIDAIIVNQTISMLIVLILFLVIGSQIYLLALGGFLNLAYNKGQFCSAFDFKAIHSLLRKIGVFKLAFVYVLGILIEYFIITSIFDFTFFIDLPYFMDFLINFFLTPFLVIFTERTFAVSSL